MLEQQRDILRSDPIVRIKVADAQDGRFPNEQQHHRRFTAAIARSYTASTFAAAPSQVMPRTSK